MGKKEYFKKNEIKEREELKNESKGKTRIFQSKRI